jgi:UDP-glucose 4-epimerase
MGRALDVRPDWIQFDAAPVPWGDADQVREVAVANILRLVEEAAQSGDHWCVLWVAGAGVPATPQSQLDDELRDFWAILQAMGTHAATHAERGSLFVASSAGGVYAGSVNPPFSESSEPVPISAYGSFKLELERLGREFAAAHGIPVLIGRIANLYGPGQRLGKVQGLISHLALSRFTNEPIRIVAPLDTVRDYIFVDDCADLILRALERLRAEPGVLGRVVTKILCSGEGTSISSLLGYLHGINKRPPRAILGVTGAGARASVDLRMRSTVWPELDATNKTPIAAGFHATMMEVLRELQG